MIENVRERIKKLDLVDNVRLDVLRTSDRSDSDSYIRRKKKILESIGVDFRVHDVSGHDRDGLERFLGEINADPKVQGILIQFPLGDHLKGFFKSEELMEMVDWKKDVDGFHPFNLVNSMSSMTKKYSQHYVSCTPKAVMRLFKEMEIDLKGVDVVLIGKSRVVGIPLMHQLLAAGATVQSCHKSTTNLAEKCRQGQIVIVAAGSANLVRSDWILPGTIVIDVGINYDSEGKLIGGDVDFEAVKGVAGYITSVPGGIGPLTIAALAENVLKSALLHTK